MALRHRRTGRFDLAGAWWRQSSEQSRRMFIGMCENTPDMQQITLRVPDDMLEDIEEEAEEHGESRSEYIRNVLRTRNEHTEDVDELREKVNQLQTDLDRVRNEKKLILEDREEKKELVRYVEEERTVEQQWREAGLLTRTRWRLFGMDGEDD